MKRIIAICIMLFFLPLICSADTGYKDINVWYGATVTINGELFIPTDSNGKTVQPFIYEGTTYMPMRAVIEALGANIEWDANKKMVIITEDKEETTEFYGEEKTTFVKKELVPENPDEIANKLIGTEYKYEESNGQYYFLTIKNISDYNLSFTVFATFYDASGKLIGADYDGATVLEKGYEALIDFWQEDNCSYVKYEFEVDKSSYTKPVQSILNYEVSELSNKIILSVTNNGDESLSLVSADIFFFKGDKIVEKCFEYFVRSDNGLEVGKTMHTEINCSQYDSYLIFFDAAAF